MLRGTLAAALTPLGDGGARLDEDAVAPYVDWLAERGVDGILALGTTGEGILLSAEERRRAAERFLEAARGSLQVAVHCGAQTTAETAALAAHAAERGADAVAAIGPPYYAFDEDALLRHFAAVARACEPVPFYLYEFRARAGYPLPLSLVARLREEAPNLAGLKVSSTPWEAFSPYLLEGLDVFVGPESLILQGLRGGAVGAVSGLASVYPELVVELVREPSEEATERVAGVRAALERFPFQAAAKHVAARRGVPIGGDVRAPLRPLAEAERAELDAWLASS